MSNQLTHKHNHNTVCAMLCRRKESALERKWHWKEIGWPATAASNDDDNDDCYYYYVVVVAAAAVSVAIEQNR